MKRLVAVTAVLLGLAGCGVPEDDSPQALSADDVPFGLLTTAPTTTSIPADPPPGRSADLYFLNADDAIEPLELAVDDRSARTVVQTLLATDQAGLPPGFSSNIPPDTELLDAFTEDGVLTVDLNEQFTTITGDRFIAAVAQVVFTATTLETVDAVLFRREGEDLQVSDEDGFQQTDPVDPLDYQGLLEID